MTKLSAWSGSLVVAARILAAPDTPVATGPEPAAAAARPER